MTRSDNEERRELETEPLGPRSVVGKYVKRPVRDARVQSYLPDIAKGVVLTGKHFFENTKRLVLGQRTALAQRSVDDGVSTICYPEQRKPYAERFRGLHRLTQRTDGSPRCEACLCCSTVCPAQCIHIESAEYPEGDVRRVNGRYPVRFVIDKLRCIFCGMCVEACPCDAIRMDTGLHPLPYDSREQFIYGKELLLGFSGRAGEHLAETEQPQPGDSSNVGTIEERGD
jgi:NADH-quinone oxidoreductase subunit I